MNLARPTHDQDAFPDSKSFIKYKIQLPAAARLAAINSRGKNDTRVEVMYLPMKFPSLVTLYINNDIRRYINYDKIIQMQRDAKNLTGHFQKNCHRIFNLKQDKNLF